MNRSTVLVSLSSIKMKLGEIQRVLVRSYDTPNDARSRIKPEDEYEKCFRIILSRFADCEKNETLWISDHSLNLTEPVIRNQATE